MNRICIITTVSLTLKSFILETAKYLHKNGGFDITFICDLDNQFEEILPPYIHYVPVSMKRGIHISGLFSTITLMKVFKREKFDMVWYSTPNASLYASLAAKFTKVPVRLYAQLGIIYMGYTGVKRKLFKTAEKLTCRNSTVIEPVGFGMLEFSICEGLYTGEKAYVVHNGSPQGINFAKFDSMKKQEWRSQIRKQLNIPENAIVLGYIGRLCTDKGITELLTSVKRIITENQEVFLLVAGDFEPGFRLDKDLADWYQNCANVRIAGYTDKTEKYYSAMDLFLFPSYREGLGMVCVEAQAMGVPVIISDIPGPSEAILPGVTGIKVPVKNSDELYKAIRALLMDTGRLESMGKKGRQYVMEKYDAEDLFAYILEDRKHLMEEAVVSNE